MGLMWFTLVCLLAVAAGQSLGDAAKKEDARREKVRQAGGSARTFTQDDLSTTPGRLANDPNAPAANGDTAAPAAKPSPAPGSPRSPRRSPVEAPAEGTEDYWRGRATAARTRVDMARYRHEELQRMIHLGQPETHDQNGRRVMYSPQQLKAQADAAATELSAAEKALENLLDEARRSGALPGWLR
jgi:hypothetical protein